MDAIDDDDDDDDDDGELRPAYYLGSFQPMCIPVVVIEIRYSKKRASFGQGCFVCLWRCVAISMYIIGCMRCRFHASIR
jgi:hypothetical protein